MEKSSTSFVGFGLHRDSIDIARADTPRVLKEQGIRRTA
jgi:hypothetical protein